jgi:hypothetical protein
VIDGMKWMRLYLGELRESMTDEYRSGERSEHHHWQWNGWDMIESGMRLVWLSSLALYWGTGMGYSPPSSSFSSSSLLHSLICICFLV